MARFDWVLMGSGCPLRGVGSADADSVNLEQDLAGTRRRLRNLLDAEVATTVVARCPHEPAGVGPAIVSTSSAAPSLWPLRLRCDWCSRMPSSRPPTA